jgi:hypothetical protein
MRVADALECQNVAAEKALSTADTCTNKTDCIEW